LRLCGEPIKADQKNSDYHYFCAICRAFPMLQGHDFSLYLQTLLCTEFSVRCIPAVETAAEIWRTVAERLLHKPHAVSCYAYQPTRNAETMAFRLISTRQTTYFDASSLLETHACTWKAWEEELHTKISAIESKKTIFLRFSDLNPELGMPSVYHVERALEAKERSTLTVQLLRYLALSDTGKHGTILLDVSSVDPKALFDLLTRIDRTFSLPSMILSACDLQVSLEIVPFLKALGNEKIRLGWRLAEETALTNLKPLCDIAALYPIGRFFVYQKNDAFLLEHLIV